MKQKVTKNESIDAVQRFYVGFLFFLDIPKIGGNVYTPNKVILMVDAGRRVQYRTSKLSYNSTTDSNNERAHKGKPSLASKQVI